VKLLDLGDLRIAAFAFTTREKDYGGLHLGVSTRDATTLIALLDEIKAAQPGYSRRVPILGRPGDLPQQIYARGAYELVHGLRLGGSVDERTRIQMEGAAALVQLSQRDVAQLRNLLADLHRTGGDVCLAGDPSDWRDRLWIWSRSS
jgi:predicted Zn-dependent protease